MIITKNFTTEEFEVTSTKLPNEIRSMGVIHNIVNLVRNVLQPARDELGDTIIITSGYRSPEVNKAVGGVENSQHTRGQAADIIAKDMKKLRNILEAKEFDQLIIYKNFIHVSWNEGKNRNQTIYKNI